MTSKTTERLYSFEEYLAYDEDPDRRYELVDGRLELMNPPTFRHILIAKFIERELEREINRLSLPWLCIREGGIRTGSRKSRLPNVYVVNRDEVMELLDKSAVCETPPFFVIEIVSPDSLKRDYRYKRSEYAALAIPEYWIVDPLENKISVLMLEEGLYEETVFIGTQQIVSPTFPELSLTVEQILASGNK